jgi:hypothetical protein
MNKLIFLTPLLFLLLIPNVYATGIRYDSDEDANAEEASCWVNGYDSGFAGMYDRDRARECIEDGDDAYNRTWSIGCKDSLRTEEECGELINNPVEIDDFEVLADQNQRICYESGREDGENNRPFNEERDDGCYEFDDLSGGYEGGYQSACENHDTETTCELKYEDMRNYCPSHPDIAACVDFLHNATNKVKENPYSVCNGAGDPRSWVICPQEINPERYCLKFDNPYCKFIGDLCDEEGFVKPEYPYCTNQ